VVQVQRPSERRLIEIFAKVSSEDVIWKLLMIAGPS
jgi:hypothetical protein